MAPGAAVQTAALLPAHSFILIAAPSAFFVVGVAHPAAQDLYLKPRLHTGRRCCLPRCKWTNVLPGLWSQLRPAQTLPGAASLLTRLGTEQRSRVWIGGDGSKGAPEIAQEASAQQLFSSWGDGGAARSGLTWCHAPPAAEPTWYNAAKEAQSTPSRASNQHYTRPLPIFLHWPAIVSTGFSVHGELSCGTGALPDLASRHGVGRRHLMWLQKYSTLGLPAGRSPEAQREHGAALKYSANDQELDGLFHYHKFPRLARRRLRCFPAFAQHSTDSGTALLAFASYP
ncbi:hypothetical protein NDU88_006473 [Pleurodeles waltl]|uniref:Uncharacterized protein n=1 Tax=Pleurodeles waltl TaxID=8319 RepID=A0AAV7LP96_PLEWA|nr:hypothetical protein NDU88_006473 [Pleurodeles waltl]